VVYLFVVKDADGGGRGMFHCTMLAFPLRQWEKPQITVMRASNAVWSLIEYILNTSPSVSASLIYSVV
jgi:hypothetical protein